MHVSDSVRIGDSIRGSSGHILKKLKKGKVPGKIMWFAVTTSPVDEGLAYILSSWELRHNHYVDSSLRVLGLAGSWMEACEILRELFQEAYDLGKIASMKDFLEAY